MQILNRIAGVMLVSVIPTSAAAAGSFSLPTTNVTTCAPFSVVLAASDAASGSGFDFEIAVDAAVALPTGASTTVLSQGCLLESNLVAGVLRVSLACASGVDPNAGDLVEIAFSPVTNGSTNLTFEGCQVDEQPCSATQPGLINVSCFPTPTPTPTPTATPTNVATPFLVCDPAPLGTDLNGDGDRDDPGEFGNGNITNADIVAIFRASLVAQDRPSLGSARFSAMDPMPADEPPACGGNASIVNSDVVQCFRRSLVGGLTNYQRLLTEESCTSVAVGGGGEVLFARSAEESAPVQMAPRVAPDSPLRRTTAALVIGAWSRDEAGIRLPVQLKRLRPMRVSTLQAAVTVDGVPLGFATHENAQRPNLAIKEGRSLLLGWLEEHEPVLSRNHHLGGVEVDAARDSSELIEVRVTQASGIDGRGEEIALDGVQGWVRAATSASDIERIRRVVCDDEHPMRGETVQCWAEAESGARIADSLWVSGFADSLQVELASDGVVDVTPLRTGRLSLFATQADSQKLRRVRLHVRSE